MFYPLLRNLLFQFESETAHRLSLTALQKLAWLHRTQPSTTSRTVMGIEFPNPIGLAAGLDKNADYLDGLATLGFGFIEVGTVTPRPQPGNPQPRMFRLVQAQALINRLGFNNKGVDYLLAQVQQTRYQGILGINIGKNADTPAEKAVDDYLHCLHKVYPYAHYVTVNISSPNTPGLRDLQYGQALRDLLTALRTEQNHLAELHERYVPLAIKVAPDLETSDIEDIATALLEHNIDGLIATNTTFSRQGVEGLRYADETGGLSGAPLTEKATQIVAQFHQILADQIPIIAVGGIMNADNAQAKLQAGASLVQIYTGLIYHGPRLVRDIARNCAMLK